MKILVYGLGRSGRAVAELGRRQGHDVVVYDRRESGPDIDAVTALGVPRTVTPVEAEVDICIAAPGVPIDHPDLAALRRRGLETIGEVEWVYRTIPGRYLGITGTAGKGTTTSLVQQLLLAAGVDAEAGGNLDPALAAVARPGATMVVELSSFQLERCPDFHPSVAAVLNLGSDHLDRHGTLASYHHSKRKLLTHLTSDDHLVYSADQEQLVSWAQTSPATSLGFSTLGPAPAWLRPDGWLELHGTALVHRDELALTGRHQLADALAAALIAATQGVTPEVMVGGLKAYQGLPGRYAEVATIAGVRFIDDSIATRPLAVEAALEATGAPIVWIAGGIDKGAQFEPLERLIRDKVALLVAIGSAAPAFAEAAAGWTETRVVEERDGVTAMRTAVKLGTDFLTARCHGRGTVLLAPLAASFDQYHDYAHRARVFRSAVAALEESWTPCC